MLILVNNLFNNFKNLYHMETQKAKTEKAKTEKAKTEKAEAKKVGSCSYDLRTAFIDKIPQGLKDRKSFMLNVVKIDVMPSNVDNLIDWLRRNDREARANEIEANKDRIFDISIIADDGTSELFNSGILAYDKKNTLKELIVKSDNGFEYYINTMTWDASNKELIFA